LRDERRASPELSRKSFDRAQRWRADMMLHSFDIVVDHALVDSEKREEVGE
jgi:hypothetical protein